MKRLVLIAMIGLLVNGCLLKTRDELRGEEDVSAPVQKQTTAMQQQQQTRPAPAVVEAPHSDEFDSQMRQLNGRLDTLETQVSQLNQAQTNNQATKGLEQKFAAYEEALKGLEVQVANLRQELEAAKAPPAKEQKVAGKSSFEMGENAFANKEWREAIVNYQKYREENAKGKNYSAATYKIGVAFMEMKMKDEAKPFFQEVVDKFPKSKEAKKAEFRLKSM